jgi:type-F conjugative transfer system pilin assembly protein TrbC
VKTFHIYCGGRETAVLCNRIKNISLFIFICLLLSLTIAKASPFDNVLSDYNKIIANKDGIQNDDNIYVFISFSMRDNLIKEYIAEARSLKEKDNINVVFVLRGFYKNSFKETGSKVAQLSDSKNVGVIVDPTLYQKYNIKQVPVIVKKNENDFDKISGSITIRYALEIFKEGK